VDILGGRKRLDFDSGRMNSIYTEGVHPTTDTVDWQEPILALRIPSRLEWSLSFCLSKVGCEAVEFKMKVPWACKDGPRARVLPFFCPAYVFDQAAPRR
jgi:hypothetical protein